jgi:hypothetical protein
MFRRNVSPPSSGYKKSTSDEPAWAGSYLQLPAHAPTCHRSWISPKRRLTKYCTMLRGSWSLMTTNCTRYSIEDAVRIVNSFITIPITRNYNHTQLFLTLLRVYTIIILTRSWLKSLIPRLHVYTVYVHYTLIFSALLHIKSPIWLNTPSLADFSAIEYYLKLSHTLHLHTSRVCLLSRPHS